MKKRTNNKKRKNKTDVLLQNKSVYKQVKDANLKRYTEAKVNRQIRFTIKKKMVNERNEQMIK